jgi:outer membrane protein
VAAAPARPRLSLRGRLERRQDPAGPPRQVLVDGVPQLQQPEVFAYTQGAAYVEVRQLLFDGARVLARVDELKAVAGQAEQQAVADAHLLALQVRQAYLDSLEARSAVTVAEESLALARQHLAIAQARLAAGKVPRGDVVLAQAPVAAAELALARAREDAQKADESLSRLLGLPQDTPLSLAEPEMPPPLAEDLEQSIQRALDKRPGLKASRLEVLAAEKALAAAEAEDNPQVEGFLNAGAAPASGQVSGAAVYQVGVDLSWPILDGQRTRWLIAQSRARLEGLQAEMKERQSEVEAEVRGAWREVRLATAAYDSALAQVSRAREALRIAEGQYRAGVIPFQPLRQARFDLSEALQSQMAAYYDYLRARARLAWARGDEPWAGEGSEPAPASAGQESCPGEARGR